MSEKKRFYTSLLMSLFIHSVVLFRLPSLQSFISLKPIPSIEVTYHKLEEREKVSSKSSLRLPPPFRDENIFGMRKKIIQKEPISIDKFTFEKKITLPEIPSPKITNPVYLNYYQMIREKIRISAYQNYIHPEEGEVYLSFCISSDGNLKKVNLINEKSKATEYLKRIALKSIQDASPFPCFPKELDFSELSFNVIISFEVEE